MTNEELISYKNGILPMPSLFASDAESPTDIYNIELSTTQNAVKFSTGYTSAYDNTENTGYNIGRQGFNYILRCLSQGSFFGQTGIRYTYNSDVATAIGGYPLGAVLSHDDGASIRNVVSLVDDNTYDFVTNGVDNQHWKYLDDASSSGIYPDYGSSEYLISAQIPPATSSLAQVSDWTEMPMDGWIYPQFNMTSGVTSYLVIGAADGSIPTVTFTNNVYKDMVPDSSNSKSYTAFLLGNDSYGNLNLIPVRAGTKLSVFGRNTAPVGSDAIGVYIRLYRNYL